jgi:hypothetical protein
VSAADGETRDQQTRGFIRTLIVIACAFGVQERWEEGKN